MDTGKLAQFIVSLGRFNNYGSTVEQTKKALDSNSIEPLEADNDDRVIFEDTLRAINAIKDQSFGTDSIIKINAQFIGDSLEQPYYPGRLRDAVQDPIRDRIHVPLWFGENGQIISYFPPVQVEEYDLNDIVNIWRKSEQTDKDAWKLFASLAKLQPFQDGNKRTALIASNHALGAFKTQDYLMPPTGRFYNGFIGRLLSYYGIGLEGGPETEKEALDEFLEVAPVRTIAQSKIERQLEKVE